MLKYLIVLIITVVIGTLIYIRLSPTNLTAIHVQAQSQSVGDYNADGSFTAVREVTDLQINVIGALNRVVLKTPRTRRVAGDIGTSILTYETRSAIFGFPDYATVSFIQAGEIENDKPLLVIHSQLRFGLYDMDVNKKRVLDWLDQLGPLTVAP